MEREGFMGREVEVLGWVEGGEKGGCFCFWGGDGWMWVGVGCWV